MATQIGSLIRSALRSTEDHLHILTAPTHERAASPLALTNATYWLIRGFEGCKAGWNERYAPLPANHILLDGRGGENQLPPGVDFDLILSQSLSHWDVLNTLSVRLQIPLVRIEHTQPLPNWSTTYLNTLKVARGKLNIFISEFSRKAWGFTEDKSGRVVHHGLNTDLFQPGSREKTPHLLSVANDFINRDQLLGFSLWKEVTRGLPTKVVGDTPGLSQSTASVDELVEVYQSSLVFLNTSLVSPIPMALLEAMACGLPCVSTATSMIPEIITHGVNGLLGKNARELREHCQRLLADPALCQTLGENARRTIMERFSLVKAAMEYERVFREAVEQ